MTLYISAFFLGMSMYHLFFIGSYQGAIYHVLLAILFMLYFVGKEIKDKK